MLLASFFDIAVYFKVQDINLEPDSSIADDPHMYEHVYQSHHHPPPGITEATASSAGVSQIPGLDSSSTNSPVPEGSIELHQELQQSSPISISKEQNALYHRSSTKPKPKKCPAVIEETQKESNCKQSNIGTNLKNNSTVIHSEPMTIGTVSPVQSSVSPVESSVSTRIKKNNDPTAPSDKQAGLKSVHEADCVGGGSTKHYLTTAL